MTTKFRIVRQHFNKVDTVIHKAMEGVNFDDWIKPRKNKLNGNDYFIALCKEIIGQQLSGKAANAILRRFNQLFDDGEANAEKLIHMKDNALRNAGMSWSKASYVKNIAKAYLDKTVNFNKLNSLSNEEVIEELTTIKGVGPWTAEMFLIFTLGREDVFSYGDLGLKKGFSYLYQIENPTNEQIEKAVTKWTPYKTYGSITLWNSLDKSVVEASKELRE
jgi:DNA-3-methyladenine glycosylase II